MMIATETAARTIVEHAQNAGSITGTVITDFVNVANHCSLSFAHNAIHWLTTKI